MQQTKLRIIEKTAIGPAWWRLTMTAPDMVTQFLPGQFLLLQCGPDCYLRRSIYPYPLDNQHLAVLLRPTSDPGWAWLLGRRAGDTLDVIGPLGNGFKPLKKTENLLLVSDGQALEPLLGQIEQAVAINAPVTLALGGSRAEVIYPAAILPPSVEFHAATSDGSLGHPGQIPERLPDLLRWADRVCAVGSTRLYRSLKNLVQSTYGHRNNFLYGLVTGVGIPCGVGACFGCGITTHSGIQLVCIDGPVFDLADLGTD